MLVLHGLHARCPWRLVFRKSFDKVTVDDSTSDLSKQMRSDRRPAHLLTLAHALVERLIDCGFGRGGQDRFATTMSCAVVDR